MQYIYNIYIIYMIIYIYIYIYICIYIYIYSLVGGPPTWEVETAPAKP